MPFSIGHKILAATVDQVGEVDQSELVPNDQEPFFPRRCVCRIIAHAFQAGIVGQAVTADGFELVEEEPLWVHSLTRFVGSFQLQNSECCPKVEPTSILFGLLDQKALEGCEVVRQATHPWAENARVLELVA